MPGPFDYDQNDLQPATVGASGSAFENILAGFRTTQDEVAAVQEYRLATGYEEVSKQLIDLGVSPDVLSYKQPGLFGFGEPIQGAPNYDAIWESLETARRDDPQKFSGVPTTRDEFERNILRRGEERTIDEERLAGAGFLPQFVGSVAGSFTDPVNILTLPLGGFGKTIAARVISEGLVNSAIEVAETPDLIRGREALGEETGVSDVIYNVAAAGVGAAALRGGFEGLGKLAKAATDRITPDIQLDFTDSQMASIFEAHAETPTGRAGASILRDALELENANPHGNSAEGTRRFLGELSEVQDIMAGKTDTAVGRFIPSDLPADIRLVDADVAIVRSEQPALYTAFEEAEARVLDLDEKISGVSKAVDDLTLGDAIRVVDEDSGNLVKSYEEDLKNPSLPALARERIAKLIDQVVQTIDPMRLERAVTDATATPRREIQNLRGSRKAAKKQYTTLRKQVMTEVEKVKTNRRVLELRKQREAAPLAKAAEAPHLLSALRYDVVEAEAAKVADIDKTMKDSAAVNSEVDDEGMIDLGDGVKVPADLEFNIADDAGNIRAVSMKQALQELKDDKALEEAMRTCAL